MSNKITEDHHYPYFLLILLMAGFWFYWSQIRVINIRRRCYQEVFTPSAENARWSAGKVWRVLYPVYDMAKPSRLDDGFWGWGYPPAETENLNYKQCLIWSGLTTSLLDIN
jgi:hypothetical protein